MTVDYDHSQNLHTAIGAAAALSTLLGEEPPASLLDIGCGTGVWLRAAAEIGVGDLLGVDGVMLPQVKLHVAEQVIRQIDLTKPFSLGRKFDMALCLEVAEHLPEAAADTLIASIVAHASDVMFSAAAPGQPGQHHVNCQWPEYWQQRFNDHGFVCDDSVRWQIWEDDRIEPWYRQNLFRATNDPARAGREPRIRRIIHPDLVRPYCDAAVARRLKLLEEGLQSSSWYFRIVIKAMFSKAARRARARNAAERLPLSVRR